MNPAEQKLKDFLIHNQIQAEHLSFDHSCHSAEDAAKAANASIDELVKNICMIDPDDRVVIAIVKGEDRASTKRVAKALEIPEIRTATPEEILERTGYPCGGTPSFGFEALFLIDPKVMEREILYTGGGSDHALVRIPPQEMQRVNQGRIVRVRK